jgi:hypothetical protein
MIKATPSSARVRKLPTGLTRDEMNAAIQEAVDRWQEAGTGDANDVKFPYDSDFKVFVTLDNLLKRRSKDMSSEHTKLPFMKRFFELANEMHAIGAKADIYGKFVYSLIIAFWGWNYLVVNRNTVSAADQDYADQATFAFKGLGITPVRPRD